MMTSGILHDGFYDKLKTFFADMIILKSVCINRFYLMNKKRDERLLYKMNFNVKNTRFLL